MAESVAVPEEAVERAARAWYEAEMATRFRRPLPWDSPLLTKAREHQREWARASLKAAAPLIRAAAYEQLAEELPRDLGVDDAADVQRALRGMASVLRGEGATDA